MRIADLVDAARAFEAEAHQILAVHESSKSRIISLNETYQSLEELSLRQEELFRQSLRCAEEELFRAAHVMAWAGAMSIILEKLGENFDRLQAKEPTWKGNDIEEMAEYVAEYRLLGALQDLDMAPKGLVKTFRGLLHTRNQCAHPTDYFPDLNQTLGYISLVMMSIKKLQERNSA